MGWGKMVDSHIIRTLFKLSLCFDDCFLKSEIILEIEMSFCSSKEISAYFES